MSKDETTKNPQELLTDNGREFANHLINGALQASESAEHIQNQLFILERMATHVLATSVLNAEINGSRTVDELLEIVFTNIRSEYAFMKENLLTGKLECARTDASDLSLH